jgi:tetratricopeptide (TPR) repeat protein
MTTLTSLRRTFLPTSLVLSAAMTLAACAKTPAAPDAKFAPNISGQPPAAGDVAAASGGEQIGMGDAPSSGDAEDRPKMSSAARAPYDRGVAQWAAGDLAGAKVSFTEATRADANAYQAFYSLGVVEDRLGDANALASYRQAYTLVPGYEPAILAAAQLMSRKGSLQEADDLLTQKHNQMPKSPAVLAALAEVKSLKKDTGTAQQMAQDALKLNPDYRPAMVVLARDHYRNRRIDLALYALKAILDGEDENNPARDKNNAEARLLRALIYKEQGRRGAAIDELKLATSLRPDFVDAKIALAALLLQSGNADEALPLLESALRYNHDHVIGHLNLGDAYRLLGRAADAKREFDYVAAKDTSLAQVQYSLGLLYLFSTVPGMDEKAQVESAIAALEKFQQLRGKPAAGSSATDDSDQLLVRAKAKQSEIQAKAAAAAAPPPAPPPPPDAAASGAPPAGDAPAPAPAP